ncbi:hypothetical protein [Kineococcus rhizosphaerae]|uniref:Uncharacterized protein n=1 Tax=Kineococcus rhizosphaerae TaxID=559628 RepID=A0A2T0R7C1_9ACTN|nr:hypothetical protein [Kineococcus rhizosphaerae]PRY17052.1 hypothetical protein CLV37_1026 [Kineococcus rhizosphaerae]
MQQQKAQPTNTGALGGIVASVAGLVVSVALAPLSIVMGLVVLVLAVRALRSGHPDRGWWTAALVLSVLCLAAGVGGTVLPLL